MELYLQCAICARVGVLVVPCMPRRHKGIAVSFVVCMSDVFRFQCNDLVASRG